MGGKDVNRPPATEGSSVPRHINSDNAPHTTYSFPVGRLLQA